MTPNTLREDARHLKRYIIYTQYSWDLYVNKYQQTILYLPIDKPYIGMVCNAYLYG